MSFNRLFSASAVAIAAATAVPGIVYAQETTSSIRGVVTDAAGAPVSGATVTITNNDTGASTSQSTGGSGAFSFRGLSVASDYTVRVTASGYPSQTIESVPVFLGDPTNIQIALETTATGDEIIVSASRANVTQVATGPSATFNLDDIRALPTINRDIKDIIRIDPRVYIDETFGDGVYCVGSSNRANSLTVDGVRQNDDFGLNANGYPTQGLPFPFDVAQQIAVEIAPFDVEYGQFTGCNINIVTRSGSNEIEARGFVDWIPEGLGQSTLESGSIQLADTNYELKYGGYVSGPIWKDRIFAVFGAERFETTGVNVNGGPIGSGAANIANDISQGDLDAISTALQSVYGWDPLGFSTDVKPIDRSFFGKIDAYITEGQRLEFSVQDTNSNRLSVTNFNPNGNELSFAGHWYNQNEKLRTYSGRLFSDWTDRLSTEIRVSYKEQSSAPTTLGGDNIGQFEIATDGNGDGAFDGLVFAGTETFRHANRLSTEVLNIKAKAEYQAGDHLFKVGYERDDIDVFNLFVFASKGEVTFDSPADLAAQQPSSIFYRNAPSNVAEDAAADWARVLNTAYIQDDWQISSDLLVTLGLRYDWYEQSDAPTYNNTFHNRYGFRNDGNLDEQDLIQPRFGFDWRPTSRWQVTGGVGIYSGGDPAVWVSNGFSNNGLAIGAAFEGDSALLAGFDGVNIPAVVQTSNTNSALDGNGEVDALDPDYQIPSIFRGALGFKYDAELPKLGDWTFGGDFLYSRTKNPNEWVALGLTQIGTAPDGRPIYQGYDGLDPDCPTTGPGAAFNAADGDCPLDDRDGDFLLRSSDETPTSYTISAYLQKSLEFGQTGLADWTFGYAYTDAEDVNPGTSSRAVSNYENFSSVDSNNAPAARSNYSIKHAFTTQLNLEYEFLKDAPTKLTFFGQLNSGRPFSYNFDTPFADGDPSTPNLFGTVDASEDTSVLYVPLENDPIVRYGANFDVAAFNDFLETSGLDEYRGRVAPRNAFSSDWFGKVDMRFQQVVPTILDQRLTFVVDIRNLTNLINDEWGIYREIGFEYNNPVVDATLDDATGQFVYENFDGPQEQRINVGVSAWQVQFGLRYDF